VVNAGIDIAVLSSFNEGTPVSLIEAQASGKPIVCTNVGGVKDTVIEGTTALICESGDVTGMRDLVMELINDNAMRSQMGNDGIDYALKKFNYNRLVGDMRELYSQLLHT